MVTPAVAGRTGLVAWRRGRPGGTADDGKHAVAATAEVGPTVGAESQCGRRQGVGSREASEAGRRSAPAQCPRADGGFDGSGALWRHW
uniref:Uncharacterized protein n=1 Tax=Oryza sativa subsp. japonica TaxID=39947 RepID=Q67WB8_ORYSJ|nr:hypothetical protein [Oryza sativa Japonica Group]